MNTLLRKNKLQVVFFHDIGCETCNSLVNLGNNVSTALRRERRRTEAKEKWKRNQFEAISGIYHGFRFLFRNDASFTGGI